MTQTVVDLPWPPSINRLWRGSGRRVYRDPRYMQWLEEAGWVIKSKRLKKIKGRFQARIVLQPPDKRKIDLDNRSKAILDLCEAYDLIEDDHLCRRLVMEYAEDVQIIPIPIGVRLTLTSISSA